MHTILRVGMAVLSFATAFSAVRLFRQIREEGRQTQVELELNTSEAQGDFKIFLAGEALLLVGFLLYAAGGLFNRELPITVGEGAILGSFIAPLYVFRQWRRRLE